jgi:hypothetical protein
VSILRRLLPHLLLALAAGGQVILYRAGHQTDEQLLERLENGDPRERVGALHILTNRGPAPQRARKWDRESVVALMNDRDPLMVDFSYTVDVCRMVQPVWQERRVTARLERNETKTSAKGETFEQWLRHFLLFRRKVAGRHMGAMLRLKNDELRWLLDGIAERPVEGGPILAAIHQRQTGANLSRTKRMAAPDRDRKKQNFEDRKGAGGGAQESPNGKAGVRSGGRAGGRADGARRGGGRSPSAGPPKDS